MKKRIADMTLGVDVFRALVLINYNESCTPEKRNVVLKEKRPDDYVGYTGRIIDSNIDYTFFANDEYEIIGHIGPDGKLEEVNK